MISRSVSKENSNPSFKIRQKSNKRKLSLQKSSQYIMAVKAPQYKNMPPVNKLISKSFQKSQGYSKKELETLKSISESQQISSFDINDFQLNSQNYNKNDLHDKSLRTTSDTQKFNKRSSLIQSQFLHPSSAQNKSGKNRVGRHSDIVKINAKIQFEQQFEQNQKSFNSQTTEASIQTDKVQFERESYQEFMCFKITKKEKFVKLQNLFQFIQNLTSVQEQNFKNNVTEIKNILEKQELTAARQTRVNELIQNIPTTFAAFHKQFQTIFAHESQILKSIIKKQRHNTKKTKDLQKDLLKNIENLYCQKDLFNEQVKFKEIKQLFNESAKQQQILLEQNLDYITKKIVDSQENLSYLTSAYERIQNNIIEQQTLIKNCVKSISQLPELCMSIFGMKNMDLAGEGNFQLKKFGVNMNALPHLGDFFVGKNPENAKDIDEAFAKCSELKCMNCTYLRSKMKFIQKKNIEIKPIVKVLNHLVNWKHERFMSLE